MGELISRNIHRLILLVFMGWLCSLASSALAQSSETKGVFDWARTLIAYSAFINYPSNENAVALRDSLPANSPAQIHGDSEKALQYIFSVDNFGILSNETTFGDRTYVEIFFRLLNVTDGHYMEVVLSGLGWMVRARPETFLAVLREYKDIAHIKRHGYPVSFSNESYAVHPQAAKYDLGKRIEALETARDPKYAVLRDGCIKKLQDAIKRIS